MESSPKDLTDQIDDATTLLLATAARLTDDQVREPSLLPGWTRGHVLTHLARGGDALRNLLDGARTGIPGQAYASQQARDAAIEAGAGRTAAELTADLRESAAAFRAAALAMPDVGWTTEVTVPTGPTPAIQLLVRRLVEIELHHVDLNCDYRPSDWPTTFNVLELGEPMRGQRADRLV